MWLYFSHVNTLVLQHLQIHLLLWYEGSPKDTFQQSNYFEDTSKLYYIRKPYELTNTLPNVMVVLEEYNFTKESDNSGSLSCKLYKTKEGDWHDIEEAKMVTEKGNLSMLKFIIVSRVNTISG